MNPRGRNGRFLKRASRRKNARRRRRNPIALAANPRRRRRRNPIAAIAANPRHRRRRRRNPIAAIAANPRRRRRHRNPRASRRRYRRNPSAMGSIKSMLSVRGLMNTLVPAGIGGAGALGVDIALAYIPLPEWFQTPIGKMVARIAGAVGVGALAAFIVPRRTAALITAGALTVTAYGTIRDFAAEQFPQLPGLSGIYPPMGADYSDTRMGYVSPAPRLSAYMNRRDAGAAPLSAYMRRPLDNVNNLSGVTSDGM